MSTSSTDNSLLYDALIAPRSDKVFFVALVASVFLHAAAIPLLPGMRTPKPAPMVITVEIERRPPPLSKAEQKATPKQPERKVEKPFERQKPRGTPTPTEAPEPKPPDLRRDVSVTPRPEPLIEHRPEIPEPVMRPERRPLPEMQPTPQLRVERAQLVTEPSRPEPLVERRRAEPKQEERVEPRPLALEPRVVPKPEQQVAPVATPRAEPILEPLRQQTNAAPALSRVDAAPTPKVDVSTVARVERQAEVNVGPRNEPALPTRQRPTSGPTHPAEQVPPRPEQIAEHKPQAITASTEVRPTAPTQSAQLASTPSRLEPSRSDIAPVVFVPQAVPQSERRIEPRIAAPGDSAPEVRRQTRPEPTIQARAPSAQESAPVVAPPQQARPQSAPKITAPTTAAVMPSAPRRNKLDVEATIQRFAAQISRQMGKEVSERDYPRLARNRRWQGTTHLLLHISADGQLGEIAVATSSGFDILDTRAIELVKRLKLPPMPADIEAHAFTVRLPVRFALRE
jgi:protein TonB